MRIITTVSILLCYVSLWSQEVGSYVDIDSVTIINDTSSYLRAYDKSLNKFGIIDKEGQVLIPFIYKFISGFRGDYSTAMLGDKFGVINRKGETTVPFAYNEIYNMLNERCIANLGEGYGVIDVNNNIIIALDNDELVSVDNITFLFKKDFDRGILNTDTIITLPDSIDKLEWLGNVIYSQRDKVKSLLNVDGQVIIDNLDEKPKVVGDLIKFKENDRYGYCNLNAEIVIPNIYEMLGHFSSGLCAAKVDQKWGFINKRGNTVIPFIYDNVSEYFNGCSIVTKDKKSSIIDAKGDLLLDGTFDDIIFSKRDSLYKVVSEEKTNILTLDFELFSTHTFNSVSNNFFGWFRDGLMKVKVDSLYGYIDKAGNYKITPKYSYASDFSKGTAIVGHQKKGLIDTSGRIVLTLDYESIVDKNYGSYKYGVNGDSSVVFHNGKIIGPFYGRISYMDKGYFITSINDKYGLVDLNGVQVLSIEFDEIEILMFGDGAKVLKDGKYGYFDFEKNIFTIDFKYNDIDSYYGGNCIIVTNENGKQWLDKESNSVLQGFYDDILAMYFGVRIEKGGKAGYYTKQGQEVLPIIYDDFTPLGNKKYKIFDNGKESIIVVD